MENKDWTRFFTQAGIPDGVADDYAHIFKTNRIRKEMLLDLTKEYLQDMGISVMGDIISILKQAKITYEKDVRGRMVMEERMDTHHVPIPQPKVPVSTTKPSEPARTITVDQPRLVAVKLKPATAVRPVPAKPIAAVVLKPTLGAPAAKRKAEPEVQEVETEGPELPPSPKKRVRVIISRATTAPTQSAKVTATKPTEVVAAGGLASDKLRSSRLVEVAERNRRIAQAKAAALAAQNAKKSTVFERLGDSDVSVTSTTDDMDESLPKKKKPVETVFDRLGDMSLKTAPASAAPRLTKPTARPDGTSKTTRAASSKTVTLATERTITQSARLSVISRLGGVALPQVKSTATSRGITVSAGMAMDRTAKSARNRLSSSASSSLQEQSDSAVTFATQKKSVFARLGR